MLLKYVHIIFFPHDAIYFVNCTSPSCCKAPPQHDASTPVLHGWDGVFRFSSLPLFLLFPAVDIDTFVPVSSSIFTRSFAVVLGLICTFRTKVHSSLGDRTRVIVCTDERGTFKCLEISPKDEPDLWRSTIYKSSWLISFAFPQMY